MLWTLLTLFPSSILFLDSLGHLTHQIEYHLWMQEVLFTDSLTAGAAFLANGSEAGNKAGITEWVDTAWTEAGLLGVFATNEAY
jgi:hypothetical protein